MSERTVKKRIGELLTGYAARFVPDDVDLWPGIATQLQVRKRRTGWTRLRPYVYFPGTFRRLVLMPTAAIFLVALLIGTGFPWSRTEGSAAEFFNSLSKAAAAQSAASVSPIGGFYYTKTDSAYLTIVGGGSGISHRIRVEDGQVVEREEVITPVMEVFSVLVPRTREFWKAPDGWGRIRETVGEPIFLGQRDRIRWEAAGSLDLARAMNTDVGPGPWPYEHIRRLPPDPQVLSAAIREQASKGGGPPVDVEMFVIVADLLREPDVSPAMRAALYKVAAEIKGVELVGKVTDRAGRPGVAVARTTNNWGARQRDIVIFDPTTSRLLAEERVLLERADFVDADPPVIVGYAVYLESAIVSKLPDQ